jgi:hypothetical protein
VGAVLAQKSMHGGEINWADRLECMEAALARAQTQSAVCRCKCKLRRDDAGREEKPRRQWQ